MAEFDASISTILKHEGGWVWNKKDPGGATKYGISLRWLASIKEIDAADINHDGVVDWHDISEMTVFQAMQFYHTYWWDSFHYERINSQQVATKVFDMAVNMGGKQAHKLVQRTLNAFGYTLYVDGVLGSQSFAAINSVPSVYNFLMALVATQKDFYLTLIKRRPQLAVFKKNWMWRAEQI